MLAAPSWFRHIVTVGHHRCEQLATWWPRQRELLSHSCRVQCWPPQCANLSVRSVSLGPLPTPVLTNKTNRWVIFLSGLAHITLPNSTDEAYVYGGENGLIFAADTSDVSTLGHATNYPSKEETRAIQVPTGGTIPSHNVLYNGPCCGKELQRRGLDDLE